MKRTKHLILCCYWLPNDYLEWSKMRKGDHCKLYCSERLIDYSTWLLAANWLIRARYLEFLWVVQGAHSLLCITLSGSLITQCCFYLECASSEASHLPPHKVVAPPPSRDDISLRVIMLMNLTETYSCTHKFFHPWRPRGSQLAQEYLRRKFSKKVERAPGMVLLTNQSHDCLWLGTKKNIRGQHLNFSHK